MPQQQQVCPLITPNNPSLTSSRVVISSVKSSVAQIQSYQRKRVPHPFSPLNPSTQYHLSELQLQRSTLQQRPRSPKSPQREPLESSGGDSEDDYVQENRVIGKAKKRTVARKRRTDDGEERPIQRKRKRKAPVEIDLSELPPEQGLSMPPPVA